MSVITRASRWSPQRARQRGLAIVVAILIVAMATSAVTYLLWYQSLARRHVENLVARAQADSMARAGAAWAGAILRSDDAKVDHLGEIWAQPLPPFEAEGAILAGSLEDEQGKFNVNNLVPAASGTGTSGTSATGTATSTTTGAATQNGTNTASGTTNANQAGTGGATPSYNPAAFAGFQQLLQALKLPTELAAALVDWIDNNEEVTQPDGAEDLFYLGRDPPYRAANRPLADISEIRRVRGFDDKTVATLAPYITALPTETLINVNTAPAEVLAAFIPGMNAALAAQVVADRANQKKFDTIDDFKKILSTQAVIPGQPSPPAPPIAVNSNYFGARATVTLGRVTVSYRAILYRTQQRWPSIIALYGESL